MKALHLGWFLLLFAFAQTAIAAAYCPAMPEAKEEGDRWYIPESAFTKEEANNALQALKSQVNSEWSGADFPNVENRLKMIKGYLYLFYLQGYKKQSGEEDKILREEFCRFMREEAFVSH